MLFNQIVKKLLETISRIESTIATRWVSSAYKRQMQIQWGIKPVPQHFDHHIDLFYKWLSLRDATWLERGIFSKMVLKGGDVLELACGDGFNTRNFYSFNSRRILACDLDTETIAIANAKNAASNIEYIVADMRFSMPDGHFDNVIWDFGFPLLDYFTVKEIDDVLRQIKLRVGCEGILSGYTVAKKNTLADSNENFRQLNSTSDLKKLLSPHFRHVTAFETFSADRHNLYYWASDEILPLVMR